MPDKAVRSVQFECFTKEEYAAKLEKILPLVRKAVSGGRIKNIICLIIDKHPGKTKLAVNSQMFAVLSDALRQQTALALTLVQKEVIRQLPPKEKKECVRAILNELLAG